MAIKNLTSINLSFFRFSTEQLNNQQISRDRWQNTSNAKFQSHVATQIEIYQMFVN